MKIIYMKIKNKKILNTNISRITVLQQVLTILIVLAALKQNEPLSGK